MPRYLFRIEAVNLSPTVYDTADISTIRGGGFYLLLRAHELARHPPAGAKVITEGASMAVLEIDTDEPPEQIRQALLGKLYGSTNGELIREMMFLVAYIAYDKDDDFARAMAALQGKIRLRQLQTGNIRIFDESLKPQENPQTQRPFAFDELNRLLPAHRKNHLGTEISNFTANRQKFGRALRQKIYKILLADDKFPIEKYHFTDNLQDLANGPQMGNLDGKIAFIYIDGNKFGRLQRDLSKAQLTEYDKTLRDVKSSYLKSILEMFDNPEDTRLEILLWGGDEIKLIVPAWMGWQAALEFYNVTKRINPQLNKEGQILEMTYAMGLVFAHHKNPIRNITRLGETLAESVKGNLKKIDAQKTRTAGNLSLNEMACYQRPQGDRLHYLVLESMETLPSGYGDFCQSYYGRAEADLSLSARGMTELSAFVKELNAGYSRSRTYATARTWRNTAAHPFHTDYLACVRRGLETSEADPSQKRSLAEHITRYTGAPADGRPPSETVADQGHHWLQTAELWDYLTHPKELS